VLDEVRLRGPIAAAEIEDVQHQAGALGLELETRSRWPSSTCSGPARSPPRPAQRVRPAVRPARAGAPGPPCSPRPRPAGRRVPRPRPAGRRRAGRRGPSPNCVTTSAAARRAPAPRSPSSSGCELRSGAGRGLEGAGLPGRGGPRPAAAAGRHAAQPVRPADLGAQPRRAAVPVQLPHRDLRAGAAARPRVLRAAVPDGRSPRAPRRPEGRPQGPACCGCRPPGSSRRVPHRSVPRRGGRITGRRTAPAGGLAQACSAVEAPVRGRFGAELSLRCVRGTVAGDRRPPPPALLPTSS
jgi:hypothetical protein